MPKIMAKSNLNLKWFSNNHENLIDEYQDKFVAIDDERIIDSDKDINELLERLKKSNRYTDSMLITFVQNRNTKLTI
jgi:hypothetical protein